MNPTHNPPVNAALPPVDMSPADILRAVADHDQTPGGAR
jgi:hypothetical protein